MTTSTDIRNLSEDQFKTILLFASDAAHQAAQQYLDKNFDGQDGGPCGFGWVEIYGVRSNSRTGKLLAMYGIRKLDRYFYWHNPSAMPIQSIDAKYAAACAAARVLRAYGFRAEAADRLD